MVDNTFVPFFINSNICFEKDDITSYDKFMTAICGNTGNSYITYALIKEIFGELVRVNHIQNIYKYDFKNSEKDIDFINNNCTHVFLILQDQIRIAESYGLKLPYQNIMNFISKLNKPIIIAGLGANSFNGYDSEFHKKLSPDLVTFLKFLSDHCIEIGIRGCYTQEILHKIGVNNTRVIGCPSFYEQGPNRVIKKVDKIDFNDVVLTHKCSGEKLNLNCIMQDFQEERFIKEIAFGEKIKNLSNKDIFSIIQKRHYIFSSIDDWKDYIRNYKFAVGHRLHGSILAINAGVPALCLNGDSRATEMCEFLKIPHNPSVKLFKPKDVLSAFEDIDFSEMNKNYPRLYDNFYDFLRINKIVKKDHIGDITRQPKLLLYKNISKVSLIKRLLCNLFYVKNEHNHKCCCFLGIKIKVRRRHF